uniref:Uncharacterized protein n=1 Tax=Arundo donax TaxID=35708 RepID=A0A0A9G1I9_ARUDO
MHCWIDTPYRCCVIVASMFSTSLPF